MYFININHDIYKHEVARVVVLGLLSLAWEVDIAKSTVITYKIYFIYIKQGFEINPSIGNQVFAKKISLSFHVSGRVLGIKQLISNSTQNDIQCMSYLNKATYQFEIIPTTGGPDFCDEYFLYYFLYQKVAKFHETGGCFPTAHKMAAFVCSIFISQKNQNQSKHWEQK